MIAIDNSVELMIKTYLGLPKRITGLTIPRRELTEASESFPGLLDLLEKYATAKLNGIDLGAVEWFHRLRNQLYHQGNGLTAERDKVEAYAVIANQLFKSLFGFPLIQHVTDRGDLLGQFIEAWITLQRGLYGFAESIAPSPKDVSPRFASTPSIGDVILYLGKINRLSKAEIKELRELQYVRNKVMHGVSGYQKQLTPEIVARTKGAANQWAKYGTELP